MTHPTLTRICQATMLAAALCAGVGAWAERADRDKPMNVEADALRHEDGRQISIFTGNVIVTKGTIQIRGEQIEVRQGAQGQQFGVVLGNAKQQAFFRQKRDAVRDGGDEHIEGVADRIEYNSQADTVKFIGRAVLRRYRGSNLNDETAGSVIVYDNTADVFTVDGGTNTAGATPNNPGGRVRAMLTPVPRADAPPAAPAAPASNPTLRPSPRLGEGRQ